MGEKCVFTLALMFNPLFIWGVCQQTWQHYRSLCWLAQGVMVLTLINAPEIEDMYDRIMLSMYSQTKS